MKDGLEEDLFIDNRKDSESAFWRIKNAADAQRDERVHRILAQEGESFWLTLGRPLYISICILFDFLILSEIIFLFENYYVGLILFALVLGFVMTVQKRFYDDKFKLDSGLNKK
ncbi:MAG: hypothetical protein HN534_06635 [Euryarchaeota archaeon]|jgi:hypothetical protein|nr:hypothetical protein [Euryarchaeota archaeon]MBT3654582.1 hypothetical protein [Euryarchaeota archaeon]MBT3757414.1 hypothetical protein [Euryarchaeota archaeon]MBT4050680.1 hypothetical protein [Euryarchaeota archaeon]MBT4346250.1 hypothetical protein [Euryarchaeota archaeon]|tara:strand:+ start:35 stop:376 length:342 start_codon:yes stop_codon:yes gene_type:complete